MAIRVVRGVLGRCRDPFFRDRMIETGLAATARRLRRRLDAGDATPADRQAYGTTLSALGFHARAARVHHTVPEHPSAPAMHVIDPDGLHVFLSARDPPPDEGDREDMALRIGRADYSYGFALAGFHAALRRLGVACSVIRHPEYVPDIRTRSAAATNLHLGFYPPEQLRLLKGAYNVLCFAWEFDRLRVPHERTDPHAFADQAEMLNRADRVWVPSRHGMAAVAGSVAVPVDTVAAPVTEGLVTTPRLARPAPTGSGLDAIGWQPLAIFPRMQEAMERAAATNRRALRDILAGLRGPPTVFVTVLNVHDYRKQIAPMLRGFAAFAAAAPGAVLLVKASTPHRGLRPINRFLLDEQVMAPGTWPDAIVSDRIWITDEVLTRAEMQHLYDTAAFYLATPHAEGQNLPLLEAMGRGVVPVSVDHTAMADYIRPDNAVIVASVRRPFDVRLTRRYGLYGLESHFTEPADVTDALTRADVLDDTAYAARSAAAWATVRDAYGIAPLARALATATTAARAMGSALG